MSRNMLMRDQARGPLHIRASKAHACPAILRWRCTSRRMTGTKNGAKKCLCRNAAARLNMQCKAASAVASSGSSTCMTMAKSPEHWYWMVLRRVTHVTRRKQACAAKGQAWRHSVKRISRSAHRGDVSDASTGQASNCRNVRARSCKRVQALRQAQTQMHPSWACSLQYRTRSSDPTKVVTWVAKSLYSRSICVIFQTRQCAPCVMWDRA